MLKLQVLLCYELNNKTYSCPGHFLSTKDQVQLFISQQDYHNDLINHGNRRLGVDYQSLQKCLYLHIWNLYIFCIHNYVSGMR